MNDLMTSSWVSICVKGLLTAIKPQLSSETIDRQYKHAASTPSDINEHMNTLQALASECGTIREFGVRGGVSTWAMLSGLRQYAMAHPSESVSLIGYDLEGPATPYVKARYGLDGYPNISVKFVKGNVLNVAPMPCDMLFIDTLHAYGQLKRELALHSSLASKYIVMHDTTIDGVTSEVKRSGMDMAQLMQTTGFTSEELTQGLWRAVEEFLLAHPDTWKLLRRYNNNNGLTILQRI